MEPDVKAVLQERARLFARPLAVEERGEVVNMLITSVGGERFAFESRLVESIVRLTTWVPLPGAPPHVTGVFLHRGRLHALVNLAALIGAPQSENRYVAVIELAEMSFGIAVDDVIGNRDFPAGQRVTAEGVVVDVAALGADSRIRVEDTL